VIDEDEEGVGMRIEEHGNDDGVVWLLHGRLTGECGDLLCRALSRAALVGRPRIVIDMSDVSMIDAGGLGTLVTVYRASAVKLIALSLVRVPARVRQLLTVTHLTMFLTVFDSAEEACACGKGDALVRMHTSAPLTEASGVERA
jgi:anti-anti-sigma factor